jgi:outer membrane protein, heavy metal efflux system
MRARDGSRVLITSAAVILSACAGSATEQRRDRLIADFGAADRDGAGRPLDDGEALFAAEAALDRAALVQAILERNPDLAAARQAWRAALAEVDGADALEDPMLSYSVAPLSVVSGEASFGHEVRLSQRLPWPGKRRLRAEVALAEAEAARDQLTSVRLELALMASNLFDDYYLVARSLEINERHQALLAQFQKSAEAQYVVGRGSQQDPIQAEVEIAHLEHDRISLETRRDILVAQLNGLLRRSPRAKLPPPPGQLPARGAPGSREELERAALQRRPELELQAARIRAGQAAGALARREFLPDLELMGSYSSMWEMPEHQWMIGVGLNLPLYRGKRHAAVERAEARTAGAERERDRLLDRVRVEVEEAYRRVEEAQHVTELYRDRLVPAARDQVDAAAAGLVSAQNSFLAVIAAERNLREVELRQEMARAELHQRLAALDRAVGRIPGLSGGNGASSDDGAPGAAGERRTR